MENKILLTFDLEEFDLPLEYNFPIDVKKQLSISAEGLDKILTLLKNHNLKATFFTTAFYAENRPQQIHQIVADGHELASHLYYHSDYCIEHIAKSKQKLEEISGVEVIGIRSPRLRPLCQDAILKAGYQYDSSLNPTYIPGRYNNLSQPRTLFKNQHNDLQILPFSVGAFLRFPLFWLSFKNIPLKIFNSFCKRVLKKDQVLHLYFHPWEFANLSEINVPKYLKKVDGDALISRLEKLICHFKPLGQFSTVKDYVQRKKLR